MATHKLRTDCDTYVHFGTVSHHLRLLAAAKGSQRQGEAANVLLRVLRRGGGASQVNVGPTERWLFGGWVEVSCTLGRVRVPCMWRVTATALCVPGSSAMLPASLPLKLAHQSSGVGGGGGGRGGMLTSFEPPPRRVDLQLQFIIQGARTTLAGLAPAHWFPCVLAKAPPRWSCRKDCG